ncbi:MAG TPA: hypothetical protein VFF65_10625 [Phycisphaerales bacterium]|nr:hypothetical protein [Phycisphaerales bacterium]
MKTWTKTACLALCAGLLVTGVAMGLKPQPADKKAQPPAGKEGWTR